MAQAKTTIANNPVSEVLMALFVIALILILLIEVPNWIINFSISLNIALGVVLLMFSLFVQKFKINTPYQKQMFANNIKI